VIFRNQGNCPICQHEVEFSSDHEWFRDHYKCTSCNSIPRERTLMVAMELFYADWHSLKVYESRRSCLGSFVTWMASREHSEKRGPAGNGVIEICFLEPM
jgi:hypothetical protein